MTTFSLSRPGIYTEEGKEWYDTKKGIAKALKTLNGFLNLRHERYQAGYIREETLNQMYVLGNYCFDTVGNCAVSHPSIKKFYPDIPDVVTNEEFQKFMKLHSKNGDFGGFAFVYDQSIPSETVCCPICQKGWSIETMHDVVTRRRNEMVTPTEFIGKTLKELTDFYAAKTDADYYIGTEPFMQNNRFIDLSPWTDNPQTEMQKTMVKNKTGWVGTKHGIIDEYAIQPDDVVNFTVIHYYHKECNATDLQTRQQHSFQEMFRKAGFTTAELQSIPNEYCKHYECPVCAPWFNVTTNMGTFKIGWRKRVINIDWSELNKKKSIQSLFAEEDVTKYATAIHAWGNDKAIEYLTKIHDFCKS